MTCIHSHGAILCVTSEGTFKLNVLGEEYVFDFSDRFGPSVLNKNGSEKAQQPNSRSLFWEALYHWIRQGKRVDADGNCIFSWKTNLVDITKTIGRNVFILSARRRKRQ
ncbi:hypothetical protein LCGC14_1951750 [marine sediment metagenome]|uniref:Uncharacterized protein n=1 Tax=marine sediment metagenome TaxID=412755 RepID=A0A0F9FHH4_9ZZZZ